VYSALRINNNVESGGYGGSKCVVCVCCVRVACMRDCPDVCGLEGVWVVRCYGRCVHVRGKVVSVL